MESTRIVTLFYYQRESTKYVAKLTKKRGIKYNWRKGREKIRDI
jgi:hypothetical protein